MPTASPAAWNARWRKPTAAAKSRSPITRNTASRRRRAAANLEFEEAGRLRDEIRQLENDELGLGDGEKKAPRVGRSDAGRPGTRKTRYGKTRYKRMGGKP